MRLTRNRRAEALRGQRDKGTVNFVDGRQYQLWQIVSDGII
jgi:hypothetical protein